MQKNMDGGGKRNRAYANLRTRPYYDRRCENKINLSNLLTNIDSLPDELVFRILLELDAQTIYESALFVCRKWYHMIRTHDFAHAHLQHSTPGLLISKGNNKDIPTFLTLRGGRIEMFKLRSVFPDSYWSTCNGLILGHNLEAVYDLFIVSPATKQHFALPLSPHQRGGFPMSCGIGYAPASMEYKVVWSDGIHGCAIFTVGVDSTWRYIDTQHLSHEALRHLNHIPLITEGFVYWTVWERTSLVSLNLESEVFTEIRLPQCYESGKKGKHYLSTWSSLTLVVESSSSGFSWDVWELRKPETGGEWKKLPNIDLESYRKDYPSGSNGYLHLTPVGWLNHGEVLVLRVSYPSKVFLLYNVVTQQTDSIELDAGICWCFSYKSSLVRLDGCS